MQRHKPTWWWENIQKFEIIMLHFVWNNNSWKRFWSVIERHKFRFNNDYYLRWIRLDVVKKPTLHCTCCFIENSHNGRTPTNSEPKVHRKYLCYGNGWNSQNTCIIHWLAVVRNPLFNIHCIKTWGRKVFNWFCMNFELKKLFDCSFR